MCNMLCYTPHGMKEQLKLWSLSEAKLHLFTFILLAEPLNRKSKIMWHESELEWQNFIGKWYSQYNKAQINVIKLCQT